MQLDVSRVKNHFISITMSHHSLTHHDGALSTCDKIGAELNRMHEMGIIRPVETHTDWCSSLTYAIKEDGNLRACLDSQKLNQALKCCPYKIPTVEEITPAFSQARYVTKLNAKVGNWSVKLAPASQELTAVEQ